MASPTPAVNAVAPYAHVQDVERSLRFYARMGLETAATHAAPDGRTVWGCAQSGSARVMLALASGPIDPAQQAVLFYMHAPNVAALRQQLLNAGTPDGGHFRGQPGTTSTANRAAVFAVTHPFYMPAGELRIHDPDGYVILVGQLE
jgi:catechol 2,3-dioxygenase-like lactoylglutathione lyase family enzyme